MVARFGDAVIYIADETMSARGLLTAVEVAAEAERPGVALVKALAAMAFGEDSVTVAPLGLVAPTADGLLVLVRGAVTAEIEADAGVHRLSGARALSWVDEVLPDPVLRVAVTGGNESHLSGCPETDLGTGVVLGGGFVWQRAGAAGDRSRPAESVAPETMQRGKAASATLAGASAMPGVAGVLAAQDGAVYPLDRPYVIGRDPLRDDAVRTAMASPITLPDPHISRVHAYVWIEGGEVFVRDAFTPGGTFIAAQGEGDWRQIGTAPAKLEPGGILRIGERILIYQVADHS